MPYTSSLIRTLCLLLFCFLLLTNGGCRNAEVTIIPDTIGGIYDIGDTATWTLHFSEDINLDSLTYTIKRGGLTVVEKGGLNAINRTATVSYRFKEPGAVLLHIRAQDKNGRPVLRSAGGIAAPDEIDLSAIKPNDFDAFWEGQLNRLRNIPKNTKINKERSGSFGVDYFKITMDNIDGTHIRGQLARPSTQEKLPALLILQWAGVYPLQKDWVTDKAEDGWLVLNINAHDLPIDAEESFYEAQKAGPLKDYPTIGNDDQDSSYFLRMYLSCYRAAQYLTEREDWDGETLVVMGTSQGGLQSLMTAGLHPKTTAALALVPAGFDMLGPTVGRLGGWPQWYQNITHGDSIQIREASRYYDIANFVPRIKCPVLVGIGLRDETCPPEGIYAGMNQLKSQKEIVLLPDSGHQNTNDSQQPYTDRAENVWLPMLREGKRPTIAIAN